MPGKVFLITGTSTGFGAELVKVVLKQGDIAIATARKPESLSFADDGATKENFLALALDVTEQSSIDAAFEKAVEVFGRVDVVVNNAGYGLAGVFESITDEQLRKQFEVNFFGLVNVTRKAMQVMRELKTGGLIQQVTSIGGQRGFPSVSIYCASKWAVEGFTESVSQEVKPEWNIKFQCVEPGGFRTDWAGRSMDFAENHPAYDHIRAKESFGKRHGTQGGDPPKAAEAMYTLATMKDPPLRCVLGSDAYQGMQAKLKAYTENVKKYEELSKSTDVSAEGQKL